MFMQIPVYRFGLFVSYNLIIVCNKIINQSLNKFWAVAIQYLRNSKKKGSGYCHQETIICLLKEKKLLGAFRHQSLTDIRKQRSHSVQPLFLDSDPQSWHDSKRHICIWRHHQFVSAVSAE
uniref:Uncharacterized protein n=1 Tax=Glossina austeni TaxID=7395 RepID=A0A1A9UGT7_GLOAU